LGEIDIDEGLRHELKAAWHRFLDLVEPERPSLHRYCRKLTGNVWDAEDLVQETMLRAFGTLGKLDYAVRSPAPTCIGSPRTGGLMRFGAVEPPKPRF
jgi:hypothetical protein